MNKRWMMAGTLVAGLIAHGAAWSGDDATLNTAVPPAVANADATAEQAQYRARAAADGAFGLNTQDYWLGASAFLPRDTSLLNYITNYYWALNTGTGTQQFEAQVNLPAGGHVSIVECWFYDANASLDASVFFAKHSAAYSTFAPTGSSVITTVASSGTGGYQGPFQSVNETLKYRDGDVRNVYTLVLNLPGSTTDVRFRACRLFWNRTISPAPATASFTDVPTSHPFFQVIEALKDSSITSGCTASTFCPDQPVLRSQMAAFLARMGGLHWPY
jgi:hypothetical protein